MNKYGLSRSIPEAVKRAVRRRCGFGCVICGATIVEYEHFFPDFTDAKAHDENRICLLCPTHHSQVTRRQIPKTEIARFSLNPKAKQQGFSATDHPYFKGDFQVQFGGGAIIGKTLVPIVIGGQKLIQISEPEEDGGPLLISAAFEDIEGRRMLDIMENEWIVHDGIWDFQQIANRYQFSGPNEYFRLEIEILPPNLIKINKLKTYIRGRYINIDEDQMIIDNFTFRGCTLMGGSAGIVFE